MAIYLNNINLNGNQLQKAVIHPLSTAPSTAAEGQVYYDLEDNVVYVNTSTTVNSPTWVNMQSGDLTGVTADGGLTGTATSGAVTLAVGAGTGITVNADDVAITAAQTGITSILNTSLTKIGTAGAQEYITFGTSNEVNTFVNNTERLSVTATGVDITGALTVSGSYNLASGDIPNNAADTSGNAATVTTNANLTGHITSSGNAAVLGSFTVAQLSAALSNASISGNNTGDQTNVSGTAATVTGAAQTNITSVGTLTGLTVSGNITANGNINGDNATNIGSIDTLTAKEIALNTSGSNTTLKILNVASKSITLGKTNTSGNTDGTSVSVENDLTVKGKLTVQGDLVTTSTSNTIIKDNIIQINDGGNASNHSTTQADMGIVMDRGTDGNVALNWDESDNAFKFIATGDTAASTTMTMLAQDENGNNVSGTTAPQGYQTLYAGDIRSVGNTSGFHGIGSGLTTLNGSNISSGTVAAARVAVLPTSKITTGTFANGRISSASVTQHVGDIVHDSLSGFAANEHFTQANITTVGTIGTGVWNGSVIASAYLDSDTAHVTQTQTLTNKTLTSPVLNTGVSGTAIKDQDDMSSNSDSHLATQQSIKAYVDAQGSSSSNTGGRQAFVLNSTTTGVAATSTTVFTITHGMGSSRNYGVEIIRNSANSGGGETVIVDVARPTDSTITVTFAVAPTAGNYTALVCKY